MAGKENKIITSAFAEYSDYIASGKKGKFSLSSTLSEDISKLSRELEIKRQLGNLTQTEKMWLRQIDEFTEKTMSFNQEPQDTEELSGGASVYDLDQKLRLEESDELVPVAIPRISHEMAENIIKGIDEQFEKKVMNEVRHDRAEQTKVILEQETNSQSQRAEVMEGSNGINLRDYLTVIRGARPEVPFADSDSQIDLSKLVNRQNHGRSGA